LTVFPSIVPESDDGLTGMLPSLGVEARRHGSNQVAAASRNCEGVRPREFAWSERDGHIDVTKPGVMTLRTISSVPMRDLFVRSMNAPTIQAVSV
jgi:hypothetical protein